MKVGHKRQVIVQTYFGYANRSPHLVLQMLSVHKKCVQIFNTVGRHRGWGEAMRTMHVWRVMLRNPRASFSMSDVCEVVCYSRCLGYMLWDDGCRGRLSQTNRQFYKDFGGSVWCARCAKTCAKGTLEVPCARCRSRREKCAQS